MLSCRPQFDQALSSGIRTDIAFIQSATTVTARVLDIMADIKQGSSTAANGTTAAQAALFVPSEDLSQSGTKIRGPDFNMPYELERLLNSYATIGFQASGLTRAIEIINKMVSSAFSRRIHGAPVIVSPHC